MAGPKDVVRIAAIGDLHYSRTSAAGSLHRMFAQLNDSADVLVVCGDVTDYGHPETASVERTSSHLAQLEVAPD